MRLIFGLRIAVQIFEDSRTPQDFEMDLFGVQSLIVANTRYPSDSLDLGYSSFGINPDRIGKKVTLFVVGDNSEDEHAIHIEGISSGKTRKYIYLFGEDGKKNAKVLGKKQIIVDSYKFNASIAKHENNLSLNLEGVDKVIIYVGEESDVPTTRPSPNSKLSLKIGRSGFSDFRVVGTGEGNSPQSNSLAVRPPLDQSEHATALTRDKMPLWRWWTLGAVAVCALPVLIAIKRRKA